MKKNRKNQALYSHPQPLEWLSTPYGPLSRLVLYARMFLFLFNYVTKRKRKTELVEKVEAFQVQKMGMLEGT